MSDDLISRKQTIEMLRKYAENKFENGEIELANGILKAVNYIENDNIPTAYDVDKVEEQQKAERWIPVSERLPKEPKQNPLFENKPLELYMVCEENMDYPCRVFWNGKIFTDGFMKVDAIAWRPLPDPYKE